MAAISVTDLTQSTVDGTGVFDALMQAMKAHLEQEYDKNRIKGPEYSTVYLGGMNAVLETSLKFLLEQQKVDLEAQLLGQQIINMQKQNDLLDQQILQMQAEVAKTNQEIINLGAQANNIQADTALKTQQTLNLVSEKLNIEANTALTNQKTTNAVTENLVLIAQECKLKAEFDLLTVQVPKTEAETQLLNQKKVTETAQTNSAGVDPTSVVGRQTALYLAQTKGFKRDAEQKAAKLMVDSFNIRYSNNNLDTNLADAGLTDTDIKAVLNKLTAGLNDV